MNPILEAKDLRKSFDGRAAVDGVSFTVGESESYGLLGPNGAGKTTTISIVCGLLRRDSGDVLVAGQPLTEKSVKSKAAIGYVPQEIALYEDLSGVENLKFFGRLYGISGKELEDRTNSSLDLVGLSERGRDRVSKYSGGMKRRLNIAAGLLHRPKLLILDEPTVGVDPQSRNAILENVEALKGEGLAVLYTTHYMEEAERLCDRVGIIDQGKIIAEGTRRELVESLAQKDRVSITAHGDLEKAVRACRELDGIEEVTHTEDGLELLCFDGRRLLSKILDTVNRNGAEVIGVEILEPDLEAVFLSLTGKALRD